MKIYRVRLSHSRETRWDNSILAENFAEAYGKADKILSECLKNDSKHKTDILSIVFDSDVVET